MTDVDLVGLDATEMAEMVRARSISATELVRATLARIDSLDAEVNAFRVVMAADALAEAARIDARPESELANLPLAGVPVAIKDDTDVAGLSTMWGSPVDRGPAEEDADVVRRLRRAGAVIIGKTNVPELTLWPWTATKQWGTTRNPWDLERTPGGSSGGSAAAVCSGMAALALGSDGGGSVRYPAGLTGLVGLKPQRDRIPLGPEHASGWHGLIVLGPLTRTVRDAALFLDSIAPEPDAGFRQAAAVGPGQLRIAVSTNAPPGSQAKLSASRLAHVEEAAEVLQAQGHELFDAEIGYGLSALWNSTVRFLKGAQHDVAAMPCQSDLESRTRAVARMGRCIPDRLLRAALARETQISEAINEVFEDADVVLTPLCAAPGPRLDDCPSKGANRSLQSANTSAWLIPWNLTGQPAIVVPTGVDDGMPTAVQLVGRDGQERVLLSLAAQLERSISFSGWPDRGSEGVR